jgi:hypothetical protein
MNRFINWGLFTVVTVAVCAVLYYQKKKEIENWSWSSIEPGRPDKEDAWAMPILITPNYLLISLVILSK